MREGSPPHTCHVSGVTCHVSHVTCHMSCVMCQIFILFFFLQSGEASQGRVCYQRGLPRPVFMDTSSGECDGDWQSAAAAGQLCKKSRCSQSLFSSLPRKI